MNELKTTEAAILEKVMLEGDLTHLTPAQRTQYYGAVCESMKLNPLTKPFDYLKLNGKLILYANKNCAEQLRRTLGISLTLPEKKIENDIYIVTARAEANGRTDEATGAVSLEHLKGEQRANAIMKAETKAKRRVTLSFAGLGMLDETEIETIPGAQKVSEKDITPEPAEKPLQGRPETLAAQAEWEERRRRMAALPQDIKDGLNWYCKRHNLKDAARAKKILEVMEANQSDPEGMRGWLRDNGWQGSEALSEIAAEDKMPA
jgi:hypothetical protein